MAVAQRVSIIGLGLMGSAIARSLIRAGHEVTVWNRTHSKAEAVAADGANAARDLADAIAASPVSIWCLLDYGSMASLMGDVSTAEALRDRTVIPTATGGPDDVTLVADVLQSIGATLLDGKIMFFPAQAGDPDAELLLSGSREAFEANADMLRSIAGGCRFLGSDPTAASVLYTAVWAYDFATRFAYMEAAALVVASGLSLDEFDRSAASRTARFATQNEELSNRFARGDFEGDQATVDIYAEGMAPMLGAFRRVGLKAYMLEAVDRYSQAAAHAGHGPQDVSVIFDMLRTRTL